MNLLVLIIGLLIVIISIFIVNRYNSKPIELFTSGNKNNSLIQWNKNAIAYICQKDMDQLNTNLSFKSFCEKTINDKDYNKFSFLAVDTSEQFKKSEIPFTNFNYGYSESNDFVLVPNMDIEGSDLGYYDLSQPDCQKIAITNPRVVSYVVNKNGTGCNLKGGFKKIENKNTDLYIKGSNIQYTYSFWIKINTIQNVWRSVFRMGLSNDPNSNTPGVYIVPNQTALQINISTATNNKEAVDIPAGNIPYQRWCHVCFTINGRNVSSYVNGYLLKTYTLTGDPILPNENMKLFLDANSNIKDTVNIGKIRIFPIAISESFVKYILTNDSPLDTTEFNTCVKQNSIDNDPIVANIKCIDKLFSGIIEANNGRNIQLKNIEQFPSSWISSYYRRPSYKIINGICYLSGLINTFESGSIAFLPDEARPSSRLSFLGGHNTINKIDITPTGHIVVNEKPEGLITLDNIHYPLGDVNEFTYVVQRRCYYVNLSKPTGGINISEVMVYDNNNRLISSGKKVTVSSNKFNTNPSILIDGNTDGNSSNGSIFSTNDGNNEYIEIDLGGPFMVSNVIIYNRTDRDDNKVDGMKVSLLDNYKRTIFSKLWDSSDVTISGNLTSAMSGNQCVNWNEGPLWMSDNEFATRAAQKIAYDIAVKQSIDANTEYQTAMTRYNNQVSQLQTQYNSNIQRCAELQRQEQLRQQERLRQQQLEEERRRQQEQQPRLNISFNNVSSMLGGYSYGPNWKVASTNVATSSVNTTTVGNAPYIQYITIATTNDTQLRLIIYFHRGYQTIYNYSGTVTISFNGNTYFPSNVSRTLNALGFNYSAPAMYPGTPFTINGSVSITGPFAYY